MRFALLVLVALVMLPTSAQASPRDYDLVPPLRCLAGNWGTPAVEWRVQVGVFNNAEGAKAMEGVLTLLGLPAERYIAVWRLDPDNEPQVVVSRAYRTRAAAERAARRYRRVTGGAIVRRFTVWS